jgi:ABC-2 type transport system ATP-binding protein
MENTIEVKDLKKSYTNNKVLKDVDFEVQKGEIFALHGSNGSGKTTIVRILSTLLKSDGGTVKICGYDVSKNPETSEEDVDIN